MSRIATRIIKWMYSHEYYTQKMVIDIRYLNHNVLQHSIESVVWKYYEETLAKHTNCMSTYGDPFTSPEDYRDYDWTIDKYHLVPIIGVLSYQISIIVSPLFKRFILEGKTRGIHVLPMSLMDFVYYHVYDYFDDLKCTKI